MIDWEKKGGQRLWTAEKWRGGEERRGNKVMQEEEEKSKKFDWNSDEMRDLRGQDDIINMQGGDDKIKLDRSAAG